MILNKLVDQAIIAMTKQSSGPCAARYIIHSHIDGSYFIRDASLLLLLLISSIPQIYSGWRTNAIGSRLRKRSQLRRKKSLLPNAHEDVPRRNLRQNVHQLGRKESRRYVNSAHPPSSHCLPSSQVAKEASSGDDEIIRLLNGAEAKKKVS